MLDVYLQEWTYYFWRGHVPLIKTEEALKDCGATLEDVVYTRVLVASQNQSDLVTAWEKIIKEFGDHDVPSTLFGVTVLGYTNQLVEIEAVAAVENNSK